MLQPNQDLETDVGDAPEEIPSLLRSVWRSVSLPLRVALVMYLVAAVWQIEFFGVQRGAKERRLGRWVRSVGGCMSPSVNAVL